MTLETHDLQIPEPESAEPDGLDEHILPKGAILQSRYEIIKVLGLGGMGAVYQARDLRFSGVERICAVKEMVSATPDPQVRRLSIENFEREANLLAKLDHPSIPKIYDFFTDGPRSYLIMEYIAGQDLEATLSDTDEFLQEGKVLDWAVQICDVLSYLHTQAPPIIFRDMKPSNVMLREMNRITLIDFGIAKAFQSGQKGTMIGTEGYSPPEQYRGVADPRGDIYALGATLHHMLTRRDPRLEPPFTFHEEPPRMLNPRISEEAEQIIMKALEYEPDNRFQTAEAMKKALLSAMGRDERDTRKHHLATAALEDMVGLPAPEEGGIIAVWEFKCEDEVRSSPVAENGVVYVGAYDNNLYAVDAKNGRFLWKYPAEGGIASTPCIWKDKIYFGSEDRFMYAVSTSGRILWTCPTEGRIRSSPRVEFDHVFFGSDDHNLYAVNSQTGRVVWRFTALAPIRSSPLIQGELIYVGSEDTNLYAVELQNGNLKWKFKTGRAVTSSPAYYQELILAGSSDGTFYAVHEKNGYQAWRFRVGKAVISSPRIVDGIAYFGALDGSLYAVEVKTGRMLWKHTAGPHIVSSPAVTDSAVYFGTSEGDIICLDVQSGKEQWKFKTGGPVPSSPFVSDGMVYVGSTDHKLYALPA